MEDEAAMTATTPAGAADAARSCGEARAATSAKDNRQRTKGWTTTMTDARLYSARSAGRTINETNAIAAEAVNALPRSVAPTVPATPLWNLTPQQWRVFLLVGKALSNKAIAHELHVAESTVKAHVSAIFKMAGCRNRTEAALLSQRVRYGLLDADEGVSLPYAMKQAGR